VRHQGWLNRLMIEQSDVAVPPGVPITSFRLVLSQEVRASLEAVREAQEVARLQARRQTRQARLWFAATVGALALAGFAVGPRLSHWWHARRHPSALARPALVSAPPVRALTASTASASLPTATAAAPKAVENAAPTAGADDGCDTTLVRTAPWRLSPEACARAFAAHPDDGALALAVAQAEHAHGHLAEGAQWAKKALALDPDAAEGYILIARAEMASSRPGHARAAYQHYLQLAPRGWHHLEARSALRADRKAPAQ